MSWCVLFFSLCVGVLLGGACGAPSLTKQPDGGSFCASSANCNAGEQCLSGVCVRSGGERQGIEGGGDGGGLESASESTAEKVVVSETSPTEGVVSEGNRETPAPTEKVVVEGGPTEKPAVEAAPTEGACVDADQDGYCANDTDPLRKDCDDGDKTSHPGAVERCDGKDNNCDGQIDESFVGKGDLCSTGKLGNCAGGVKACTGGKIECIQIQAPVQEKCDNGVDDDCDGMTDEGCRCQDGRVQSCYSGPAGTEGVGSCQKGTQRCNNGRWEACRGASVPQLEECDGLDNDCNGKIDEVFVGQGAVCQTGEQGICATGSMQCLKGKKVCVGGKSPSVEICNKQDDDCDGQIDEGNVCGACQDGQTQSCYTGPQGTQGVGLCKKGTQTCTKQQWGACVGEVVPQTELCNGKDDDCDGQIDESFAEKGQACKTKNPGICEQGVRICTAGAIECLQTAQPQKEICDGKDNDCDGQIDEGVKKTFYQDKDGDGFGVAAQKVEACTRPSGYSEKSGDCYDSNQDVFPGQTRVFDRHRGDGSFDYDCSGQAEREFPLPGRCVVTNGQCTAVRGFLGNPLPGCGNQGQLLDKCKRNNGRCEPETDGKRVRCK